MKAIAIKVAISVRGREYEEEEGGGYNSPWSRPVPRSASSKRLGSSKEAKKAKQHHEHETKPRKKEREHVFVTLEKFWKKHFGVFTNF